VKVRERGQVTQTLRINDVHPSRIGAHVNLIAKHERRGKVDGDEMGTTIGDTVNQAEESGGREPGPGGTPRYTRRLSDKILIAFHHACDQADFEVAEQLLHILEMMLTRRPLTPDGTRRRNMESLVAAHERLWHLRHPHTGDDVL